MAERLEKIKKRAATIFIGIPIVLIIIHLGGHYFNLTVLLLAIVGSVELCSIFKKKYSPSFVLASLLSLFFIYQKFNFNGFFYNKQLLVTTIIIIIFIERFLADKNKKNMVIDISLTLFIAVYIGYFLSFLVDIRNMSDGKLFIIFVLFSTWMSDTMAYLVGVNFGKNHIFPEISPNKTLEGSIGGILGGSLCGLAFYFLLPLNPLILLILGFISAVFGQTGDLFESMIKRNFDVKDSGSIIPGHGGILDCMDSILFSVPVLYFCLNYVS